MAHGPGKCYLVPSWAFCCFNCQTFFDSYDGTRNTRENAMREARQNGWKLTKDGWVCPDCYPNRRQKQEATNDA